jgi:hypothetical protein
VIVKRYPKLLTRLSTKIGKDFLPLEEIDMTVKRKKQKPKHLHLITDDEKKIDAAIEKIFRDNEYGFRMIGPE